MVAVVVVVSLLLLVVLLRCGRGLTPHVFFLRVHGLARPVCEHMTHTPDEKYKLAGRYVHRYKQLLIIHQVQLRSNSLITLLRIAIRILTESGVNEIH